MVLQNFATAKNVFAKELKALWLCVRFKTSKKNFTPKRKKNPQRNVCWMKKKEKPQRNVCWMPERGMFLGQYSVKALHSLPPFVRGHLTPKF